MVHKIAIKISTFLGVGSFNIESIERATLIPSITSGNLTRKDELLQLDLALFDLFADN